MFLLCLARSETLLFLSFNVTTVLHSLVSFNAPCRPYKAYLVIAMSNSLQLPGACKWSTKVTDALSNCLIIRAFNGRSIHPPAQNALTGFLDVMKIFDETAETQTDCLITNV